LLLLVVAAMMAASVALLAAYQTYQRGGGPTSLQAASTRASATTDMRDAPTHTTLERRKLGTAAKATGLRMEAREPVQQCTSLAAARCRQCNPGGAEDNGSPLQDGICMYFCSRANFCGRGPAYMAADTTDCRGCSPGAAVTRSTEPMQCEAATLMKSTEFRGEEYFHTTNQPNPTACCQHCSATAKCAGFTYNAEERFCRFKGVAKKLTVHKDCNVCTSWVKDPANLDLLADCPQLAGASAADKPTILRQCDLHAPPAPKQPDPRVCRDPGLQDQIATVKAAFEETLKAKEAKGAHPATRAHPDPNIVGLSGTGYGATDVVLIVAWQRPAFLMAALQRLLRADAVEEHLYLFQMEHGYYDDVLAVVCAWPLPKRVALTPAHAPGDHGPGYTPGHWNSFTVLEGYRTAEMIAREFCSRLLYMLEEDIFVSADFFLFHRAAHTHSIEGLHESERKRIFAVTAYNSEHAKDQCDGNGVNSDEDQKKMRSAVFTKQFYHSLGVSIPVAMLPVVTQHANLQFYNQPADYNEREFGTVSIYKGTETLAPNSELEQDSLIGKREFSAKNLLMMLPYCSRAYHAGFVGYNRKTAKAPDSIDDSQVQGGSLLEQVATLLTMGESEMNADAEIKDIRQIAKEHMDVGYNWTAGDLHCGWGLREYEKEKWKGSKCDFSVSCECHAFGGGWW
jgi:hypothetical protein